MDIPVVIHHLFPAIYRGDKSPVSTGSVGPTWIPEGGLVYLIRMFLGGTPHLGDVYGKRRHRYTMHGSSGLVHLIWVVVSNISYVHSYLGKIPILTHIFQVGWFNHQLVLIVRDFENQDTWRMSSEINKNRLHCRLYLVPCKLRLGVLPTQVPRDCQYFDVVFVCQQIGDFNTHQRLGRM